MADIGEERRLGTIELSQCLGAAALLLIRLRVGDGGCDLSRNEAQEAPVVVVEQAKAVEANDENARPSGFTGWQNGNQCRLLRRLRPGSRRDVRPEDSREVRDHLQVLGAQERTHRPKRRTIKRNGLRRRLMTALDTGHPHELCR